MADGISTYQPSISMRRQSHGNMENEFKILPIKWQQKFRNSDHLYAYVRYFILTSNFNRWRYACKTKHLVKECTILHISLQRIHVFILNYRFY